ncbi:MAG: nucleotidyltransferase family protein [Oscillochloris sp.]|nr:nucleotidyltransferase family protein [Oscillochloris sp.]
MQQTVRTIWEARATTEQQVLLAALRAALNPAVPAVPAPQAIDWDSLLSLAERHRVLPLLVAGLLDVPALLRDRARAEALRSMMLAGELRHILSLLKQAGVTAIPYKGPALALQIYGNAALRQGGDLDLLIAPRDLMPARQP